MNRSESVAVNDSGNQFLGADVGRLHGEVAEDGVEGELFHCGLKNDD